MKQQHPDIEKDCNVSDQEHAAALAETLSKETTRSNSNSQPWPFHPKCGVTFPPGDRTGHCGVCCRTFYGNSAFESHRRGPHGRERHCIDPGSDAKLQWYQDDWQRWRLGVPLTDEDKARIWGERK